MKNNKQWFGLALAMACSSMYADISEPIKDFAEEAQEGSEESKALRPFVQMQLGYGYTGGREVSTDADSTGYTVPKINAVEFGIGVGAKQPLSDTLAFSVSGGVDASYNIVNNSTFSANVQPVALGGAAGITVLVTYTPSDAPVSFSVGAFAKHATAGFQDGPGNLFNGRVQKFGFVSEFMLNMGPFDGGVVMKLGYATKGKWTSVNTAAVRGLVMTKRSEADIRLFAQKAVLAAVHMFLMSDPENMEDAKAAYYDQIYQLGENPANVNNTNYEYGQALTRELNEKKGNVVDTEEDLGELSLEEAKVGLGSSIASDILSNYTDKLFEIKERIAKSPKGMQAEAMRQYQKFKNALRINVTCGEGVYDAICLHGKEMPVHASIAFILRWSIDQYAPEVAGDELADANSEIVA